VRERRLRWPIAAHFESAVRGQSVRSVERRAKYILIRFDTGTLILHLGMSGSLRLVKASVPPKTHDHWTCGSTADGCCDFTILAFRQPALTNDDPEAHPLLAKLAPNP